MVPSTVPLEHLVKTTGQVPGEVLREFIYNPDIELGEDNKEIQETSEDNDGSSPNVFGSNTFNEDSLNEAAMTDEEEYDTPTFMRRKNK